jgi:hypothetical protein
MEFLLKDIRKEYTALQWSACWDFLTETKIILRFQRSYNPNVNSVIDVLTNGLNCIRGADTQIIFMFSILAAFVKSEKIKECFEDFVRRNFIVTSEVKKKGFRDIFLKYWGRNLQTLVNVWNQDVAVPAPLPSIQELDLFIQNIPMTASGAACYNNVTSAAYCSACSRARFIGCRR